ncbi:serine hydrolase, partial [Actinomadura adrarensis]
RRLDRALRAALKGRRGTESVAVYDRVRRLSCGVQASRRYDSASVIKVTVLAALLRKHMAADRRLTKNERALAHRMITRSDNDATSALWRSIGRRDLQHFLTLAKMRNTTLGKNGHWGLSQLNAADQIRLLRVLTRPNKVLNDRSRRYALSLMSQVVPAQRWGTTAGRPTGIDWHVKNGWLPRHGRHWRVHSIGAFDGRGRDYMIVVLTRDTPSMRYGVQTIERVARAVHRTLNPGRRAA